LSEFDAAMREILVNYEPVNPTTWAYLSSLLMIAVYFKFNRFFSIRNLDLVGLIALAPALLMVQYGRQHAGSELVSHAGYIWLFVVSGLIMLRLLLDALLVRRPLLEPNLSAGGLSFLGVSLFVFLIANVIAGKPDWPAVAGSERAAELRERGASANELNSLRTHGPGFPLIFLLPQITTQSMLGANAQQATVVTNDSQASTEVSLVHVVTAQAMAILSQLAIVIGLVIVGLRHFDNVKTGIAAATLYLLLPYTAMWTGSVTHALPGALVVWAIVFYRWPTLAGAMIGLAFGTIYYPVFLLPLWISFYWQRGLTRFLVGCLAMVAVLVGVLAFKSADTTMFWASMRQMFGIYLPLAEGPLSGAWGQFWRPIYRFPIIVAHVALSLSMVLWPAQKNLGTLIAYSAALMLGTQFWHAHSGGLALAWYLPLLLLATFRPNLEDRVAAAVVR
jgi:hypothetical protein